MESSSSTTLSPIPGPSSSLTRAISRPCARLSWGRWQLMRRSSRRKASNSLACHATTFCLTSSGSRTSKPSPGAR
ncbi:hypothetical protein LINGRAHAP2_LOCUS6130 [Linum grandiflorum]